MAKKSQKKMKKPHIAAQAVHIVEQIESPHLDSGAVQKKMKKMKKPHIAAPAVHIVELIESPHLDSGAVQIELSSHPTWIVVRCKRK